MTTNYDYKMCFYFFTIKVGFILSGVTKKADRGNNSKRAYQKV